MKKKFITAIAISLILHGCSKQDPSPAEQPPEEVIPQKPAEESEAPAKGTVSETVNAVHVSLNLELSYNKFITIDADGDGKNDFYFASTLVAFDETAHLYLLASPVSASGSRLQLETGAEQILNGQSGRALPSDAAIGSTPYAGSAWNSFMTKGILIDILQGNTGSTVTGSWAGNQDKYLGMELKIGGKTHYGWIQLKHSGNEEKLTIAGFAYNKTPLQSIKAGQIPS